MPISKLTSLPFPPPAVPPFSASGQGLVASVNQLIDTSVASLKSLPTSPQTDTVYNVVGFYSDSKSGGGNFHYDPAMSQTLHNGGTVISPESILAWNGTQADIATLLNWAGSGSGCWVRLLGGFVTPEMFGAVGDGVTDDVNSIQSVIDSGFALIKFSPALYIVSRRLKPVSSQSWIGVVSITKIKLSASAATNESVVKLNGDGLEGSLDDFYARGIILDANGKDAAFLLYGCNRLKLIDMEFKNSGTYGCGLQSRPGFSIDIPQDNIEMTRCHFTNNGSDSPGWDGLDIKWCTNARLVACYASGNTDVGINVRGRDVDMIGCVAFGNGTDGILLQSNDATEDSVIRLSGCSAYGGTGSANGLHIQTVGGRRIDVIVSGFHSYENAGAGIQVSGSGGGKVHGVISAIESFSNYAQGVNVIGDVVGQLVFDNGLIMSNAADGFNNSGKNCVLSSLKISGNSLFGYREGVGADNNYVMPSCIISGNVGGQVGVRVGSETDSGFLSVRSDRSIRVFPGADSGIEFQVSSSSASFVSVGDAASIDLRLITKGNGDVSFFKDNGVRQIGVFREAGSASVNYPDFVSSLTGQPIQFRASGTDSTIDIKLEPKGSGGRVSLGTHTASADAPVTGYIEIKDAGGTIRKLAVIS